MKAILALLFLSISFLAFSEEEVKAPVKLNEFKKKTKIKDPFNLRDPFKAPLDYSGRKQSDRKQSILRDGVYTNMPYLDPKLPPDVLKVVGIIVGEERRAIVSVGGKTVIVKEGMKIGPEQAELKAILPGGIVLVEKMTNVYGQEEFLETVIPLSK